MRFVSSAVRNAAKKTFQAVIAREPTNTEITEVSKTLYGSTPEEKAAWYVATVAVPSLCHGIYKELLERTVEPETLQRYVSDFCTGKLTPEGFRKGVESSEERKLLLSKKNKVVDIRKAIQSFGITTEQLKDQVTSYTCVGLRVKYMGPVGRTGYAQAAKAYVYAFFCCGAKVVFEPLQDHGYINSDVNKMSMKDRVLYACANAEPEENHYDIVVLHSVPDQWADHVVSSRKLYPKAKIVGITVWETDKIHPKWIPMMNAVDAVITPCEWNGASFSKDVRPPVYVVHNPVDMLPDPDAEESARLKELLGDSVVFYTINEWTGRKGVEDLVKCFLRTFTASDNVVLYLKCSSGNPEECKRFVQNQQHALANPPKVIYDGRDVSDRTISALHERGGVCCSFTRAEGTGLGAAEAVWWGNVVVISGYGGQLGYMKGCFFISCYEERPLMCTSRQSGHSECSGGVCKLYPWYLPEQQWGHPIQEDGERIFRFVKDNLEACKTQCRAVARPYLLANFSSERIGAKLRSVVKSITNSTR